MTRPPARSPRSEPPIVSNESNSSASDARTARTAPKSPNGKVTGASSTRRGSKLTPRPGSASYGGNDSAIATCPPCE